MTTALRVSPSLAAAGFQEMRPVSGALASNGDALTGIRRADTASVRRCSIAGQPARATAAIWESCADCTASIVTGMPLHKFLRGQEVRARHRCLYVLGGANGPARGALAVLKRLPLTKAEGGALPTAARSVRERRLHARPWIRLFQFLDPMCYSSRLAATC